jgi:hypothetical protein
MIQVIVCNPGFGVGEHLYSCSVYRDGDINAWGFTDRAWREADLLGDGKVSPSGYGSRSGMVHRRSW